LIVSSILHRPGNRAWWATVLIGGGATLALLVGPGRSIVWESSMALFVIVTVAASLCVVGAAALLWICHQRNLAEAGLLAGGLMVVSILPLVHGLTAPGVLYGANSAVMTSVYVALPLALFVMGPLVLPTSVLTGLVGRHWRTWVGATVGTAILLAGVLLRWPNAVTAPGPGHPLSVAVAAVGLGGALWVSRVQLRLHWIGERRSTLVASLALVLVGLSSLVWVGGPSCTRWRPWSTTSVDPGRPGVGRGARDCGCSDALPELVRELLNAQP